MGGDPFPATARRQAAGDCAPGASVSDTGQPRAPGRGSESRRVDADHGGEPVTKLRLQSEEERRDPSKERPHTCDSLRCPWSAGPAESRPAGWLQRRRQDHRAGGRHAHDDRLAQSYRPGEPEIAGVGEGHLTGVPGGRRSPVTRPLISLPPSGLRLRTGGQASQQCRGRAALAHGRHSMRRTARLH